MFFYKIIHSGHSRTIQVKKQIIYSFFIKGISICVTLGMVPLLIDMLDEERYGVWLTLSTIFLWFSNFDIGLGNGLRNKLAEAITLEKYGLAKIYISTTYALLVIIFGGIAILFTCINSYIDWNKILNTNVIGDDELLLLTSVTFVLFILRFIFQTIGVIYIALQRPAMNNWIVTLGNLSAFILILVLYKLFQMQSLLIMGIVLTGVPLLVMILVTVFAFRGKLKRYSPSVDNIRFTYAKPLFNLGGQFFLIQITAVVLFSTANLIITQIFGPTEVVVYNVVFQYYNIPIMVYSIILMPIWSAITAAYVKDDYLWMKQTLRRFNYLSLLFVIGIIIMTIVSPIVYEIWLNGKLDIPMKLSVAMAFYAIVNVLLAPYTSYINGLGKLRLNTILVCISLVSYIPLAIWGAKFLESSIGIIMAICVINATGLYFQVRQVNKLLNRKAIGVWNK